jgi:hypothetical protein
MLAPPTVFTPSLALSPFQSILVGSCHDKGSRKLWYWVRRGSLARSGVMPSNVRRSRHYFSWRQGDWYSCCCSSRPCGVCWWLDFLSESKVLPDNAGANNDNSLGCRFPSVVWRSLVHVGETPDSSWSSHSDAFVSFSLAASIWSLVLRWCSGCASCSWSLVHGDAAVHLWSQFYGGVSVKVNPWSDGALC